MNGVLELWSIGVLEAARALAEVAQISNLLYRRVPACETFKQHSALERSQGCRLEIGDTAD